jgi:hypothetical protein
MASDVCGQAQTPSWHSVLPYSGCRSRRSCCCLTGSTHTPSQASPCSGRCRRRLTRLLDLTDDAPATTGRGLTVMTHASPQHALPNSVLQHRCRRRRRPPRRCSTRPHRCRSLRGTLVAVAPPGALACRDCCVRPDRRRAQQPRIAISIAIGASLRRTHGMSSSWLATAGRHGPPRRWIVTVHRRGVDIRTRKGAKERGRLATSAIAAPFVVGLLRRPEESGEEPEQPPK